MLRLRTTTGLSVLALLLGVAGTGWLSTLTADGHGSPLRVVHAPDRVAATAASPAVRRHATHPRHTPPQGAPVVPTHSYRARAAVVADAELATLPTTTPELIPLATPADTSLPWAQLRGHLDGQVVLQVSVNGHGRVDAASVARSSGDEVLDAHALRSVWHWRFAVPAGNVSGLHGEVPVRYASTWAPP